MPHRTRRRPRGRGFDIPARTTRTKRKTSAPNDGGRGSRPRRSVDRATLPIDDLREGRLMTEASPLTRLLRLVSRQYGVFHRHQATDLGLSDSRLHGLVRAGRIQRVLPAVFRDVAVPTSLTQKMKAAELWAGPEGCLCASRPRRGGASTASGPTGSRSSHPSASAAGQALPFTRLGSQPRGRLGEARAASDDDRAHPV